LGYSIQLPLDPQDMNQLTVYHWGKIYSAQFSDDEFQGINTDQQGVDCDDTLYEDQLQTIVARIKCESIHSNDSNCLSELKDLSAQLVWESDDHKKLEVDPDGVILALLKTQNSCCLIRHFGFAGGYYISCGDTSKYHMIVSYETYDVDEHGHPHLKNVVVANFNHDEDEGMGSEVKGESQLQDLLGEMEDLLDCDREEYGFGCNIWRSDEIEGHILNTLPEHWLGQKGHQVDPEDSMESN
jgi:hypothetical protein